MGVAAAADRLLAADADAAQGRLLFANDGLREASKARVLLAEDVRRVGRDGPGRADAAAGEPAARALLAREARGLILAILQILDLAQERLDRLARVVVVEEGPEEPVFEGG